MKKIALLFAFGAVSFVSNAQISLTGASPYVQNFDGIGSGLPAGWTVYSGAASNFLGTIATYSSSTSLYPSSLIPDTPSTCVSGVVVGGFKNYPSADVLPNAGVDFCAATPPTFSNRALGVRQVSPTNTSHPNLDSGAAFVLTLTNTKGITAVALSFKLQSLDSSSPRITTWIIDYAIGTSTTFIPVTATTGTFTTGGHLFSNNTCTASFGNALDNQTQPVTIRIATIAYSSGAGNRASTAIDDFNLTYSGMPTTGVTDLTTHPEIAFNVLGATSSDKINFQYNAEQEANYTLAVYDMTGRIIHTESVLTKTGVQQISVDGLHLTPGMYVAKMSNSNSSAVTRIMIQ